MKVFEIWEGCREDGYLEIKEIADDELHKAFSSLKSCKLSVYNDISSNIVEHCPIRYFEL